MRVEGGRTVPPSAAQVGRWAETPGRVQDLPAPDRPGTASWPGSHPAPGPRSPAGAGRLAASGRVVGRGSVAARVRDALVLCKPRIVAMLVFSGIMAAVVAARGVPDLGRLLGFVLAGSLAAAGAAALNQYFDRDIDALMERTAARPLPAGRMKAVLALYLGVMLSAAGVAAGFVLLDARVGGVLLAGVAVYAGVYTLWLKRRTVWNIVIGGAAGSLMVLAGWRAQRPDLTPEGWLLLALLFLWTPSHFWPLSLALRDQYARAGIPMLPVLASRKAAVVVTVANTLLLVGVTLLPAAWGFYALPHTAVLTAAGAGFLALTLAMAGPAGPGRDRLAWWVYKASGPYLGVVLVTMAAAALRKAGMP